MNLASFQLTLTVNISYFERSNRISYLCQSSKSINKYFDIVITKYLINNKLHRVDGPALIQYRTVNNVYITDTIIPVAYDELNFIAEESYYLNGKHPQDGRPAKIIYEKSYGITRKKTEYYYSHNSNFKIIYEFKRIKDKVRKVRKSHVNNLTDMYTVSTDYTFEVIDGKNRKTGEWHYLGSSRHRIGLPASTIYNLIDNKMRIVGEYFYINDRLHRDEGPAVIIYTWTNGKINHVDKHYYLNGIKVQYKSHPCYICKTRCNIL